MDTKVMWLQFPRLSSTRNLSSAVNRHSAWVSYSAFKRSSLALRLLLRKAAFSFRWDSSSLTSTRLSHPVFRNWFKASFAFPGSSFVRGSTIIFPSMKLDIMEYRISVHHLKPVNLIDSLQHCLSLTSKRAEIILSAVSNRCSRTLSGEGIIYAAPCIRTQASLQCHELDCTKHSMRNNEMYDHVLQCHTEGHGHIIAVRGTTIMMFIETLRMIRIVALIFYVTHLFVSSLASYRSRRHYLCSRRLVTDARCRSEAMASNDGVLRFKGNTSGYAAYVIKILDGLARPLFSSTLQIEDLQVIGEALTTLLPSGSLSAARTPSALCGVCGKPFFIHLVWTFHIEAPCIWTHYETHLLWVKLPELRGTIMCGAQVVHVAVHCRHIFYLGIGQMAGHGGCNSWSLWSALSAQPVISLKISERRLSNSSPFCCLLPLVRFIGLTCSRIYFDWSTVMWSSWHMMRLPANSAFPSSHFPNLNLPIIRFLKSS